MSNYYHVAASVSSIPQTSTINLGGESDKQRLPLSKALNPPDLVKLLSSQQIRLVVLDGFQM